MEWVMFGMAILILVLFWEFLRAAGPGQRS